MNNKKVKSPLKIYVTRLLAEKGLKMKDLAGLVKGSIGANHLSTLINANRENARLFVKLAEHLSTTYEKLLEVVKQKQDEDNK